MAALTYLHPLFFICIEGISDEEVPLHGPRAWSLAPLKVLPNDRVISMIGPPQSFFHWVADVDDDIAVLGGVGGIGLSVQIGRDMSGCGSWTGSSPPWVVVSEVCSVLVHGLHYISHHNILASSSICSSVFSRGDHVIETNGVIGMLPQLPAPVGGQKGFCCAHCQFLLPLTWPWQSC